MKRYERMSLEELAAERNELVNEFFYWMNGPDFDESIAEDITSEIEFIEFMMLLKQ